MYFIEMILAVNHGNKLLFSLSFFIIWSVRYIVEYRTPLEYKHDLDVRISRRMNLNNTLRFIVGEC